MQSQGSYQATGTIRAVFITRNGEQRFVFDFDEPPGLLHIFRPAQIEPMEEPPEINTEQHNEESTMQPYQQRVIDEKPNLILR
ncbi:MAG: hypothetical protein IPK63_19040 [Candidatus Competibacteraceae bacterium]|nr:hypothetical protein [Candidatus Competibacteraceae bacterium]